MKNRKNTKTEKHVNKKMNESTYALRKQVMAFIYEIKEIVNLPRIEVRITDAVNHRHLASARMGDCVIWVTENGIKNYDLRTIVYHEVCHAVWAIEHDEKCPLMKSIHSKLTKKQCQKLLLKWATSSRSTSKATNESVILHSEIDSKTLTKGNKMIKFKKIEKDGCGRKEVSRVESKCGRFAIRKEYERSDDDCGMPASYTNAVTDWEIFTINEKGDYAEQLGSTYTLKEAKELIQQINQEDAEDEKQIKTREQKMNNEISHDKYYRQFVNNRVIEIVANHIGLRRILNSTDEHFNDISLRNWDNLYSYIMSWTIVDREAANEGNSLATCVCIAKAAARMIKEQANEKSKYKEANLIYENSNYYFEVVYEIVDMSFAHEFGTQMQWQCEVRDIKVFKDNVDVTEEIEDETLDTFIEWTEQKLDKMEELV